MPDPLPTVGVREYARHRGCSPKAVRKAIDSGRLAQSVSFNSKGWPRIVVAVADAEWEENTSSTKAKGPASRTARARADEEAILEQDGAGGERGLFGELDQPGGQRGKANANGLSLLKAQTVEATYRAQLTRLKFEREDGQLVRADEVRVMHFKMARQVREAMEQIPDRVADRLAAENDAHQVRQLLQLEIRKALGSLSDGRSS